MTWKLGRVLVRCRGLRLGFKVGFRGWESRSGLGFRIVVEFRDGVEIGVLNGYQDRVSRTGIVVTIGF